MSGPEQEYCKDCAKPTGGIVGDKDMLAYIGEAGPYCQECHAQYENMMRDEMEADEIYHAKLHQLRCEELENGDC